MRELSQGETAGTEREVYTREEAYKLGWACAFYAAECHTHLPAPLTTQIDDCSLTAIETAFLLGRKNLATRAERRRN